MGGRIGHEVREKNGLAYYAASSLSGGFGPGPWYAYAGVNPDNVERAVGLMQREIARFLKRRVTPDEISDNKAQFIGRLPLGLETNEGVASTISSMELFDLGLDYLLRFPAMFHAITRDDIQDDRAGIPGAPSSYVLAVAGPEVERSRGAGPTLCCAPAWSIIEVASIAIESRRRSRATASASWRAFSRRSSAPRSARAWPRSRPALQPRKPRPRPWAAAWATWAGATSKSCATTGTCPCAGCTAPRWRLKALGWREMAVSLSHSTGLCHGAGGGVGPRTAAADRGHQHLEAA